MEIFNNMKHHAASVTAELLVLHTRKKSTVSTCRKPVILRWRLTAES